MDYKQIKDLRKENNYTQDELANMLGISRVTYNQIENGKANREQYKEQLEDIFDVSFHAINNNKDKPTRTLSEDEYTKAKNLILYILDKISHLPNVGKTVIYKILYFCEFDRYELTGNRLTGMDFVKLPRGPAPAGFDYAIRKMMEEEQIIPVNAKYMGYLQQRYLLNTQVSHNFRSGDEKVLIDRIINKMKDMNAKEISDYSHGDLPWMATKDMEMIDIELAKERSYPYSAKQREIKVKEDMSLLQNNRSFSFLHDEPDLYDDLI